MAAVTNLLLPLYELLVDPTAAAAAYTHLRWFRSVHGSEGPYEAITGVSAGAAVLVGTNAEPHALNGKVLSLKIDGLTTVDISFAGPDPYSTADAISDIMLQAGSDVAADDDGTGRLRLTSVSVGTAASIEILESDGAIALGFQTGLVALGTSADVALTTAHQYFFTDSNGSRDYWYRTQLVNNLTSQVASPSAPFPGSEVPVLDYSYSIPAYVRLVDLRGRPIEGRKIIIANVFLPNRVGNASIFRHSAMFETDETGYGEIRLLRGSVIDVHVEGTTFTRRVTLPGLQDITDIVDLLDPSLSAEDEFGIQEPNIDFAIRTS